MIKNYFKLAMAIIASLVLIWSCKHKAKDNSIKSEKDIDSLVKTYADTTQLFRTDSQYKRINDLGGVFLVKYDYSKRCNLDIGIYYLVKAGNDSQDLRFLAKFLATRLYKNHHNVLNCDQAPASQVLIYRSFQEYNASG